VHTENTIIDNSSQRQVIEYVSTVSPDIQRAILPQALVIETINLSDLSALMIATDKSDKVRIAHFIGQ